MSRKPWIVIAAVLAATTATAAARADEPTTMTVTSADESATATAPETPPPPPVLATPREAPTTVYENHRPNKVLMITGASLLVGTYAVTASFAGAGERAADRDLFVPGAGPFMNLANRNCSRGCTTDGRDTALIITSGVLQNIGATLMIISAFVPNKVAVGQITAGSLKMNVAPTASAGGAGLGAIGTF